MKFEKSCGAIVLDGDKILLIQQKAGHWGFPKGHVEGNETEIETAIREIKEETNLDVSINENYRYVEHYLPKRDVTKDVVIFVAKKIGGQVKPQEEEVQTIEWVSFDEAMNKITFKDSREVLAKAWEDLKK